MQKKGTCKEKIRKFKRILRDRGYTHNLWINILKTCKTSLTTLTYQRKKKFGYSLKVYALTLKVLIRQPRTFQEVENAAPLTQTVQQSIQDAKGTYSVSRRQQQLHTLVSSLAAKEKAKKAPLSAYQFSPQISVDEKLANLRREIKEVINLKSESEE